MVVAAAYRAVWDRLPGSTAWKIGSFGGCADDDAVALDDSKDREDLPSPLLTPRTGRRPQARPVHRRTVCDEVWLGRSDWSCRDTPTVGKTVRERSDRRRRRFATDAPATWLSTRCSRSGGSISRRRHRQYARGRAVFPRRRTGAKSQLSPSSLRQGAPVNRRHGHVEDALDCLVPNFDARLQCVAVVHRVD